MLWLNSAKRFACAPTMTFELLVVVLPALLVWPVWRSYPPTCTKNTCRFMPMPPEAAAPSSRLDDLRDHLHLLEQAGREGLPPLGTVTVVGNVFQ